MSKSKKPIDRKSAVLCFWASALFPVTLLWFLYNRNATEVPVWPVIQLSLVFFAVFAVLYGLILLVFRSPVAGAVASILGMFALRSGASLCSIFEKIGLSDNGLFYSMGVCAVVILLIVILIARVKKPLTILPIFFALFVGVFFLMNAFPFVRKIVGANAVSRSNINTALYKTEFQVDHAENDRPNIYWLHLDGMLGFDTYQKYYGDDQEELEKALSVRGFVVDRGASFEALHITKVALTALVSPYFYDTFLSERLTNEQAKEAFADSLSDYISTINYARLSKELFVAFSEAGYRTVSVSPKYYEQHLMPVSETMYFFPDTYERTMPSVSYIDDYYNAVVENPARICEYYKTPAFNHFISKLFYPVYVSLNYFQKLPEIAYRGSVITNELSSLTPPILLPDADDGTGLSRNRMIDYAISDVVTSDVPCVTMICLTDTHAPFLYDENGHTVPEALTFDVSVYKGTHTFFSKILLSMVDLILERDPNAVIVLQGDHGLHLCSPEAFTEAFGVSGAETEMWNDVMSAVRVPEKYQTGEEEYAYENPLNITRYLVNTFVGENYEYLPPSE